MFADTHLHIISFDVPYPPDYGGVVDVYYRIKALSDLGVKVHLHCFEYGRGMPEELKDLVFDVQYYKRRKTLADSFHKLPFIVKTRDSKHLIQNLLKDDHPILFEGLHSCYYLSDERLKQRLKIVRMHNIEHDYYRGLAKQSEGFRKRFFRKEAKKLEQFENILKHANQIYAIKESDRLHFEQYGVPTQVLPASVPELSIERKQETEPYCLFHGNLSVSENEDAVSWLISKVFIPIGKCDRLIVAGKSPKDRIRSLCDEHGVKLFADPSHDQMNDLIRQARVHVFYSALSTGVKLKLLNAMASSGHIIVNHKMVEGNNLVDHCNLALIEEDYQYLVQKQLAIELDEQSFQDRINFLNTHYNTRNHCADIIRLIELQDGV